MKIKVKFAQNANILNTKFSEDKATFDAAFQDVQVLTTPNEGQNGATFFPSVSDDGVISWTNDQNLPNPPTVNIKGDDGYTPVKGIDYFDGRDGKVGEDGFSPIVGISKSGKITTLTITDKNGEHTAEILDGNDAEVLAITTFDLTKIGMPIHIVGGSYNRVTTDTSEIIQALSNGLVRFKFATNIGNISAICNQLYSDGLGLYLAISSFFVEDVYGDFVIVVGDGYISLISSIRLTMTDVDTFIHSQDFVTNRHLDWYISDKGFQTKDDVEKLIEKALGVIENGTY